MTYIASYSKVYVYVWHVVELYKLTHDKLDGEVLFHSHKYLHIAIYGGS